MYGDSKTGDSTTSPKVVPEWVGLVRVAADNEYPWRAVKSFSYAKGGLTVAQWAASWVSAALSAEQAAGVAETAIVLINLGVNDVGFTAPWVLPNQTTWQNNYLSILDSIHAQYPTAEIYISKPYKGGGDDSVFDTLAGWIDNVVAARAFAHVGDDERNWFKPNIATYSDDNVHYNAAGQAAKAAAVKTVLGY